MDPVCPDCETEGCWYIRDGQEEGVEVWMCENGHTFVVAILPKEESNGHKKWKWF